MATTSSTTSEALDTARDELEHASACEARSDVDACLPAILDCLSSVIAAVRELDARLDRVQDSVRVVDEDLRAHKGILDEDGDR